MGLVDKFEAVEVKNISRISEADRAFGVELEAKYNLFRDSYMKYMDVMNTYPVSNEFDESRYLLNKVLEMVQEKTVRFISKVVSYFEETYSIAFNEGLIAKKYDYKSVSFEKIVDEIILQLNGCSFMERADRKIKEKLVKSLRYAFERKEFKSVKNRLCIEDYIGFEYHWDRVGVSSSMHEKLMGLFTALSHFECGRTEAEPDLLVDRWGDVRDWLEGKTFTNKRTYESIKFFKNGRVDIKFTSSEFCQRFCLEYCGFVPAVGSMAS